MANPRRFRLTIGGMLLLVAVAAVVIFTLLPRTTRVIDVKAGTGAAVKAGSTVSVHYVGKLADGTVFDASKPRGQPADFVIGEGQLIKGWDIGMIGMRAGGTRRLVVPPQEAYGELGVPGVIPPNATLTFEIDLLGVR